MLTPEIPGPGLEDYHNHATTPPPPQLIINVLGTPVAQGSKVANTYGRGVRDTNAETLKPWRQEVAAATVEAMREQGWTTLDDPCEVAIVFHHRRGQGHYGTGRNAGTLKPTAPVWKHTSPDVDKLARAVLDALTAARAYRDDARVARLIVEDRWADSATGARIILTPLDSAYLERLPSNPTPDTNREPEGHLF